MDKRVSRFGQFRSHFFGVFQQRRIVNLVVKI